MNTTNSTALQDYYAQEREALATEASVRAELRQLGVARVLVDYDGVGDSGQIEQFRYLDDSDDGQDIAVDESTNERVEALLYALLELRHGGWENDDGAYGSFCWNLVDGTLAHEHNQRYTDHHCSIHMGFGANAGEPS